MKEQLRSLILKLQAENEQRIKIMEDKQTLPETHRNETVRYYCYLDIVRQLEVILLFS